MNQPARGASGTLRRGIVATAGLALALSILLAASSCRRVERPASAPGESGPATAPPPERITTAGGFEMVRLPAGRFPMGSTGGEADETPVHEVAVDAFLIDRREITQAQWARLAAGSEFLSPHPSHFKGPDLPVEMIGWDMAALFCNVRSRAEGLQPCYDEETGACNFEADGYRLPTEAEWEYACRAGTRSDYSFGPDPGQLDQYAWYDHNAAKKTHPVAQKKPNPWGLFDMHGNVAEWCNDRYAPDYYATSPSENPRGPHEGEAVVLRGGGWNCTAGACRSARRVGEDPGFADACFARDAIGFRCVRKAPPQQPAQQQPAQHTAYYRPPLPTGLVYGDVYLDHHTGTSHPERPQRLTAIIARLRRSDLFPRLLMLSPRKASVDRITTVHLAQYVQRVKQSCRAEVGWVDSPDAPASARSYDVACYAAGGVLAAVDAVMEGKVRNAFCAVRPPGHHALPDRAMGFCLFNNVAIAARYVQKKYHLPKVLIVDWDVHHGNGTQEIFYRDPTVFYFSVHQFPFYPGTGSASEKGEGDGLGTTLNAPLPAGSGDQDYQRVFEQVLKPAALEFDPDFVLVSAGFDAHRDDPLGGMRVSSRQFGRLTLTVKQIAETCCDGRLVSVLEGGYGLEGLAESVEAHVRALLE